MSFITWDNTDNDAWDKWLKDFGQNYYYFSESSSGTGSASDDVAYKPGTYTITLQLPGVAKEEVSVSAKGQMQVTVTVAGKEITKFNTDYTYSIPFEYDISKSTAKMANGLLKITLQKKEADPGATIPIE